MKSYHLHPRHSSLVTSSIRHKPPHPTQLSAQQSPLRQQNHPRFEPHHHTLSRMQRMIDQAHLRNQVYSHHKSSQYRTKIQDINAKMGVLEGPMPRPVYWSQKEGPLRPARPRILTRTRPDYSQEESFEGECIRDGPGGLRRKERDGSRFSQVSLEFESPDRERAKVDLDLSQILNELDCEECGSVFRNQGIETADFFLLKEEDLRELKLPLGARNRIIAYWESLKECPEEVAADASQGILNHLQSRYFKDTLHAMPRKQDISQNQGRSEEVTPPLKREKKRATPLFDPKELRERYSRRMQDIEEMEGRRSLVQDAEEVQKSLTKEPSSKDQVRIVSSEEEEAELRQHIPEMTKHPIELDEEAKRYSQKLQASALSESPVTPDSRPSPVKTPELRYEMPQKQGTFLTPGTMTGSTCVPSPSYHTQPKRKMKIRKSEGERASKVLWSLGQQLNRESREKLRTIVTRKIREKRYDLHCGIHRDREWQHLHASEF